MRINETHLFVLQERFLSWGGAVYSSLFSWIPARRTLLTPSPYQQKETFTEKVQKLPTPSSLALIPYWNSPSSESICFFSKHCGHDAINVIETAILSAKTSIFLKIFSISSKKITRALAIKSIQGVSVSMLYHHISTKTYSDLSKTTIELIQFQENSHALLHNKTLIIDKQQIITGNGNFTSASLCEDVNLMMRINNMHLASLMEKNQAGRACIKKQKVRYLPVNRKGEIVKEIQKASSSIQLGMYILTNEAIIKALDEAASQRSVLVTIIIDPHKKAQTLGTLKALNSKIRVRAGTLASCIHCKVCIIDHKTVIIGSANWSNRGLNTNKEDLLIISPLTEGQKQDLNTWWHFLCENSTVLAEEEIKQKLLRSLIK